MQVFFTERFRKAVLKVGSVAIVITLPCSLVTYVPKKYLASKRSSNSSSVSHEVSMLLTVMNKRTSTSRHIRLTVKHRPLLNWKSVCSLWKTSMTICFVSVSPLKRNTLLRASTAVLSAITTICKPTNEPPNRAVSANLLNRRRKTHLNKKQQINDLLLAHGCRDVIWMMPEETDLHKNSLVLRWNWTEYKAFLL